MTGVAPSLLLYPLDFMGCDDDSGLGFFPAMNIPRDRKDIDLMPRHWNVGPMINHAAAVPSRIFDSSNQLEVAGV